MLCIGMDTIYPGYSLFSSLSLPTLEVVFPLISPGLIDIELKLGSLLEDSYILAAIGPTGKVDEYCF